MKNKILYKREAAYGDHGKLIITAEHIGNNIVRIEQQAEQNGTVFQDTVCVSTQEMLLIMRNYTHGVHWCESCKQYVLNNEHACTKRAINPDIADCAVHDNIHDRIFHEGRYEEQPTADERDYL